MEDYGSSDEYLTGSDNDCDQADDNQDVEILEDEFTPTGVSSKSTVITKESLLAAQMDEVKEVMDLFSLREHHARTVLIHYQWDADKVFKVFVEMGKAKLYADAGIKVEEHDDLSWTRSISEVSCDICMEDVPKNQTTRMDCNHFFCNNCWTDHFIVQITEGQSRRIRCMAYKCNAICDEGIIRSLVRARDHSLSEKFEKFLLESYIDDNKWVKWCPSVPHCGNAIRVKGEAFSDEYCEVECACGKEFCFRCSSEPHSPCSCLMWDMWAKKCSDESETVNWIIVNTKPCPKCHKLVEKNRGCNLVRCICRQPFCWLCGEATGLNHTWDSIAGHTCGGYKPEILEDRKLAGDELKRYIHYYNRFKAHSDSLKAEVNMKESLQQKVSNLKEKYSTVCDDSYLIDLSWVADGFYRLSTCRKILSYSYPFAYYMFGDNLFEKEMTKEEREIKQNLFEDQQQQFEKNIETLSKFLEEPFDEYDKEQYLEAKRKIVYISTFTDKLCKRVYECIENDLLGQLQHQQQVHIIAPYMSKKASKL